MSQSTESESLSLTEAIRRRQDRTRNLILVILGLVAFGVVILLASLASGPRSAYDGIPQAMNAADGAPLLGRWDNPPVTLVVFLDFADIGSARLHKTLLQLVDTYIRPGKVLLVEYLVWTTTLYSADSLRAAEACYCAGEQGAFWPMHDALFNLWERQFEAYGRVQAPPPVFSDAEIMLAAQQIQINPQEIFACRSEGRRRAALDNSLSTAESLGVATIPAVYLNGEALTDDAGRPLAEPSLEQLQAAIDARLAAQP